MASSVQERLMEFATYKGIPKQEFQRTIGVSNSYIQNIVNGIGSKVRLALARTYPELNMTWLETGEGTMLNELLPTAQQSVREIPVVTLSSAGLSISQFLESCTDMPHETFISPIINADLALSVTNDSMLPTYNRGMKAIVGKINPDSIIEWGCDYVLDSDNGAILRRVMPTDNPDVIMCHAENPAFPSFMVNKSDIKGWYKVLMTIEQR